MVQGQMSVVLTPQIPQRPFHWEFIGSNTFGDLTTYTDNFAVNGIATFNTALGKYIKVQNDTTNGINMLIKGNATTSAFSDATINVRGSSNISNTGEIVVNTTKVTHQGSQFSSAVSYTKLSGSATFNSGVNLMSQLIKAKESNSNNVYDAYINVNGTPSTYATGLGFSQNTTGNSCGTMQLMASRIDIGNVANCINIGAVLTDSAGFTYNQNYAYSFIPQKTVINIGNSLSKIYLNGQVIMNPSGTTDIAILDYINQMASGMRSNPL
jgi:hypothetical protein